MSLAGGDPLVYPQIVDLVKMIKEMGWKPIVNTNGLALDETLLRDLKPVNFESDGRQDMCDCCPDITVHEGKLVWSCRLEELNKYGAFVQTVPKKQARLT
jgi:organic radical activating enzyme